MIHQKQNRSTSGVASLSGTVGRTGTCRVVEPVVGGAAVREGVQNRSARLAAAVFRHRHHRRGDAAFEDGFDALLNPDQHLPAGSGG
jgi:hypothetical protein